MRLLSSAPLILIAGFIASATAGTVLPVEFAAESRLSTSAAAHQSRSSNLDAAPTRLNAGQKSEVMRDASGGERSQCGDAGRISRSESRASAEFFTGRSKFDLVLSTDLRAQGGYFTVGRKYQFLLAKTFVLSHRALIRLQAPRARVRRASKSGSEKNSTHGITGLTLTLNLRAQTDVERLNSSIQKVKVSTPFPESLYFFRVVRTLHIF